MKKVLLFMILGLIIASGHSNAQTFVGLGVGAAMPETQYPEQSNLGLHGEFQYGVHKFCNMWPVFTVNYGHYAPVDSLEYTSPRVYSLPNVVNIQANIRWFPWDAPNIPLYLSMGTGISIITGDDEEGKIGMPGTLEAGYLFHYDNPCCDWFLTLAARYTANNMLRDLDRPHLSGLSGMITLNFPLGGGR
ncbi:MAG: hypothetical protein ACKOFB_04545 [bacterium]